MISKEMVNIVRLEKLNFILAPGASENSKQQNPNFKQIPISQIQNSKHMIRLQVRSTVSSPADQGLRSCANQLW
jgi:hypothetical protein